MAKKNVKIKGAWFNLELEEEIELCKHADSLNFSDWVKQKLAEDILQREHCQTESPSLDPKGLAALVETLVETKLAGRIIATDQAERIVETVDMDQFF